MTDSVLVYGYHPVREALRHRPESVLRVLVAVNLATERGREIERLCRQGGVALESASRKELDSLTGKAVHNGFAAESRPVGRASEPAEGEREGRLVVLLEDVSDPRNLGAILRVCDGVGVERVLIRDRGSAPLSPAAVKTSAGAAEYLAVERVANSAREIERLKKEGFWVYGADAAGPPVWKSDLRGDVCLALGGEQKGLRARTRSLCDGLVSLPMRGRVESLNVAAAAAALLYEIVRQRVDER